MPRALDIKIRRGTAAAWTTANPILDPGEPGVELDTHKLKIGDGSTTWNSLAYIGGAGGGSVSSVSVVSANGFAGSVATPTTTPAITLSTTINGLLAGNGTAVSAQAMSSTPAAGTVVQWDSNVNLSAKNFLVSTDTSTAMAGGTTTLTIASSEVQVFTGSTSTGQTVKLPSTGVPAGFEFIIANQNTSTGALTVQSSGANTIATQAAGTVAMYTAMQSTPSANTHWAADINVAGKYFTTNNSMTIAGTDNTTMTFPTTNATIARTDAAQTFTGVQTMTSPSFTTPVLGTPTSGTLTNCTGLPLAGLLAAAYNTTPTASTLSEWDASKNLSANNFPCLSTSTATAAGTTTLTITSARVQVFTGTTTQTVQLPTTSVTIGLEFTVINQSTGIVTITASGGTTVTTVAANAACTVIAGAATPTTNTQWWFWTGTQG